MRVIQKIQNLRIIKNFQPLKNIKTHDGISDWLWLAVSVFIFYALIDVVQNEFFPSWLNFKMVI